MPTIDQLEKQIDTLAKTTSIEPPYIFSLYDHRYEVSKEKKHEVECIFLQYLDRMKKKSSQAFADEMQKALLDNSIYIPKADIKSLYFELSRHIDGDLILR